MNFKIKLGFKKSTEDHRDFKYNIPLQKISLPSHYTLENKIRQIFTQSWNDCVCNGTSNLICSLDKDNNKINTSSRLFLYYNVRQIEENGSEYIDEGCTIRGCMKSITKYNFIDEQIYNYDSKNVYNPPQLEIYELAKNNKYHINYYRNVVNSEYNLKYIISQANLCIVFGAQLFESFTNLDHNFCVPDPDVINEKCIGGHAMIICQYSDVLQCFGVINSWGTGWAKNGMHYMSYKYICSDLCSDFWCISNLEKD